MDPTTGRSAAACAPNGATLRNTSTTTRQAHVGPLGPAGRAVSQ